MGKTAALILAAGQGTRFGGRTPKQFLELAGKALWERSLEAFLPFSDVTVVVTDEAHEAMIREALEEFPPEASGEAVAPEIHVTRGGDSRAESVLQGLRFLEALPAKPETVLIHDAARCLVTPEIISACLREAEACGAAIAAVPMTDTVKEAVREEGESCPVILDTPDRSRLYKAQTPQGFSFELILGAYEAAENEGALPSLTDDASAVERFTDRGVRLTPGSPENVKITDPMDLALAETILRIRFRKKEIIRRKR